jgi:hypothetical protein
VASAWNHARIALTCFCLQFTINPHGFAFIGLYFILCEALLGPLLASLNLRGAFRERGAPSHGKSGSAPGILSGRRVLGRAPEPGWEMQEGESREGRNEALVVHITQSTLSQVDEMLEEVSP